MEENNNTAPDNMDSSMNANQTGSGQQPTPQSSEVPVQETPPQAPESSNKGPVTGIVVIVILLIFAGLYFWGATLNKQAQLDESTIYDTAVNEDLTTVSDEPAQIENDLDSFDTAGFDAQLEADLQALEAGL